MLRRFIVAAALVSSASAAIAAPTYIHAGRLIAVPGKAALGPSTIIVDNGRIVEVRDGHQPPPAGASAIDLRDRTVLPGLIDSHVHLVSDRGGVIYAGCAGRRERSSRRTSRIMVPPSPQ